MFDQYLQFFLGSNTKKGFVPLFEQLSDPLKGNRMYILKGGPGCGKSSLMKRIAKKLSEQGHRIEYIPCSSDPLSLDAILDYDAKVSLVDGTAPHILEPKYPGAYDIIINMGEAWNQEALTKHKAKIIELTDMISGCHSMATYCIKAAVTLLETNRSIASPYINRDNVRNALGMFTEMLKESPKGPERKRLLSAVSIGKIVFLDSTLTELCPKLYEIRDEWGAASEALLTELYQQVTAKKLEVITCYCSVEAPDKIDHLIFPSIGIGVTTANSFHETGDSFVIQIKDLMEPIPESDIAILSGNLATAHNLIDTACIHVEKAKNLHDELEKIYIGTMDFSKVDALYQRLIREILQTGKQNE